MKYPLTLLFLLSLSLVFFGQDEEKIQEKQSKLVVGFEIDLIPYITGGYHASVWLGFRESKQRLRPVIAKVNIPEFLNDDGIEKNTIQVYAIMTDYFFKPGLEKFWIATGIEYWDGKMTNSLAQTSQYDEWIFTVGVGYVWNFWNNFYIDPWISGHIRIAGDENVQVGEDNFKIALITPDVSLKIGWHF